MFENFEKHISVREKIPLLRLQETICVIIVASAAGLLFCHIDFFHSISIHLQTG